MLGDSAYATGNMLAVLKAMKWTPLLKPWPIKPAVEGGFTIDDYRYDAAANTFSTCPAGVTRKEFRPGSGQLQGRLSRLPATRTVHRLGHRPTLASSAGTANCNAEHRQRAADPDWRGTYRTHRPMVKRSITWLTRRNGNSAGSRGMEKNNNWLHHRAAALNLRRLLASGLNSTGPAPLSAPRLIRHRGGCEPPRDPEWSRTGRSTLCRPPGVWVHQTAKDGFLRRPARRPRRDGPRRNRLLRRAPRKRLRSTLGSCRRSPGCG